MTCLTKDCDMELCHLNCLSHINDALGSYGCIPLSYVTQYSITDLVLKQKFVVAVLTGVRVL